MTEARLTGMEAAALIGADQLADDELAGQLAEAIDMAATFAETDTQTRIQDLVELATLALVTARRLAR